MAAQLATVTFDSHNAAVVAAFWAEALGFDVVGEPSEFFAIVGGPNCPEDHPTLMFNQVPEGKELKNRIHFDLIAHDGVDNEITRLAAIGAARVQDKDEGNWQWTVMRDPEGNEFCVSRPHD